MNLSGRPLLAPSRFDASSSGSSEDPINRSRLSLLTMEEDEERTER
jgi:hypothetical protein